MWGGIHRNDIKFSKRDNIDDLDKNDLNDLVGKNSAKIGQNLR